MHNVFFPILKNSWYVNVVGFSSQPYVVFGNMLINRFYALISRQKSSLFEVFCSWFAATRRGCHVGGETIYFFGQNVRGKLRVYFPAEGNGFVLILATMTSQWRQQQVDQSKYIHIIEP